MIAREAQLHVKWMIRRDLMDVLAIASACSLNRYTEDEFTGFMRGLSTIALVAELDEKTVGFAVYELAKFKLILLDICVHPDAQRRGVGSGMVNKLKTKLQSHRRTKLECVVRESSLPAQLFFRTMGFKCSSIKKEYFRDTGEDGYKMVFALD